MKFRNLLLLAALSVSVVACNSTGDKKTQKKAYASAGDMRCKKDMRTGSHINKKRCISKKQAEQERDAAQEDWRRRTNKTGERNDSAQF